VAPVAPGLPPGLPPGCTVRRIRVILSLHPRTGSPVQTIVHKFGGTSVADAACFRHVAALLAARPEGRPVAVVSAMRGVTDALIHAVRLAGRRDDGWRQAVDELHERHRTTIAALEGNGSAAGLLAGIEEDVAAIRGVLHAATLLRTVSPDTLDLVSGYGEVWSAQMLALALQAQGSPATWLDARDVLTVTWRGALPDVDWGESRRRLEAWLGQQGELPRTLVVTGFVARTHAGVATTLGRNGSDFSASIFAALFDAAEVHIWTDVDGVMSANPRLVPDALLLDSLSYDEAMELAYFGAKVIHPSTMAPAVQRELPIRIRNTFRPEHPGTRIHLEGSADFAVKGLASIEGVALLNVEGTGMIGVPGTAQRLFGALRDAGVSVVMISQGSSEHSICFAVADQAAEGARLAVEEAFFAERHHGQIQTVEVVPGCSILAVVGDGMAGRPGIAASFFGALGRAGVNIRAIAQGSSERNISAVVDGADTQRALRAVHAGFYLSRQTISIGLVGPGIVGAALLRQLAEQADRLRDELNVDLRVRAIAGSRRMLLGDRRIHLAGWREHFAADAVDTDLDALVHHVHAEHLPHAVIIDCTADDSVAQRYHQWLRAGIHVITPNKRANTAALPYYRSLRSASREGGAHYFYEATVGAGLPIIQTLRDLIRTGDRIISIEGILSGTLSYLFNRFDGTEPFSAIVEEARALGYTEPDPRDDLSGTDVARKVVILARETGAELGLPDVAVTSLVPAALQDGTVDQFLAALPRHDAEMSARHAEAAAAGQVLRYVGSLDHQGRAAAELRAYPATHPFARIQLTDNVVLFRTHRYNQNPLVVQGPGAGPDVTAAGVFGDLLRLAAHLGAPS
jgi:bifunctional aspartokinase / homoserine dehydrogenase 1